MNYNIKCS